MANLFDLTGEYLELLNMAEDEDVDIECLKDTMEAIEGEIEIKADGYVRVMKQILGDAEVLDEEIKRLTARKKALENKADYLKRNLQNMMEVTGKTKFKTSSFSYSIQKNPMKVVIDDEANIPDEFLIPQNPTIDKDGILAAIKEGKEFAFAHTEQGQSLRIR